MLRKLTALAAPLLALALGVGILLRKHPTQLLGATEDERVEFRRMIAEMKTEDEAHRKMLRAAFEKSPAVRVIRESGREEVVVFSPDTTEPGKRRFSYFMPDGPWSHEIADNLSKLIEMYLESNARLVSVEPMSETAFMCFTSTPEFVAGAKRVAFMQALNALTWRAGQKSKEAYTEAFRVVREAQALPDIEAGTRMLQRAFKELQA